MPAEHRPAATESLPWAAGALAFAILPHLQLIDAWIGSLALMLIGWRLLVSRQGWPLPGRVARTLMTLGAGVAVFATRGAVTGLDAGSALLVLMAGLKVVETQTRRDHVIVVFIGWFLCLAALLHDQSLLTAAWVLIAFWLLAATLLTVARTGEGGLTRSPFGVTGRMLVLALPLMVALFLFFPRVAGHFWGIPGSDRAISGLGDELAPGDISELTLADTVAFRVRFDGPLPPPEERYWRGPVLSETDGYSWRQPRGQLYPFQALELSGSPLGYQVTMEPSGRRTLLALEMVDGIPATLGRQSWDYRLVAEHPIDAVIQYRMTSHTRYRTGEPLATSLRRHNLSLPADANPRSRELALSLREAAGSDRAFIAAVLQRFRDQEFFYTLRPPLLQRNAVDDFLFNTRRGFCGHYATSFSTLMRAAGLPARVVTGYQGGDWNPRGGYLVVRQSHAHAWSEVWLEGSGWTRVDPTAAVAPERILQDLQSALPAEDPAPGRLVRSIGALWELSLTLDGLRAAWNDWIVRYSADTQTTLLEELGIEEPDWRQLGVALVIALGCGLLWVVASLAWSYRPKSVDAPQRWYLKFNRRLAAAGLPRRPEESATAYLARVVEARPELASEARAITRAYLTARYEPVTDGLPLTRLSALVRHFRA
ncbi:MAG: transglutaminase TgpA family protein [Steroidobacteraceae bacterium]